MLSRAHQATYLPNEALSDSWRAVLSAIKGYFWPKAASRLVSDTMTATEPKRTDAVIFGIIFRLVEFRRYKSDVQREAAVALARSFQTQEFVAAIRFVLELSEPMGISAYNSLPESKKDLVWLVFGSMETIGIRVFRGDLPIELVDELYSIPVVEGWRKLVPLVEDFRDQFNSPQTWEWYQWLHERMCERHNQAPRVSAHVRS